MEDSNLDRILSASEVHPRSESGIEPDVYIDVIRQVRSRHAEMNAADQTIITEMVSGILARCMGREGSPADWDSIAARIAEIMMTDEHARERIQRLWARIDPQE
jgi:hypothetical protein